jgi:hypothetical protein
VTVLNNSMITGLAARASWQLRSSGWPVTAVGNYPESIRPVSAVYYRPDAGEEAEANTLAARFGVEALPRFPQIAHRPPGLILIVTQNWPTTDPR